MKMGLVLLLLCSGFFQFTFAVNRLRSFNVSITRQKRHEAVTACNQINGSLVTLYDEEDANFTHRFLPDCDEGGSFWLGLKKTVNLTSSPVNITGGQQLCGAIDNGILGNYSYYNCSERKPFICYKDGNYTLIEKEKDWCQALKYCRTNNSVLANISHLTQANRVTGMGDDTSYWTGVLFNEWEWQDESCSTFRTWGNFDQEGYCTAYERDTHPRSLYRYGCDQCGCSFCSKGTVRIRVIEEGLTWEQAYNYCKAKHTDMLWIEDKEDQQAVEQWLNRTDVAGPFWIGLRQSRVFGTWIWASNMLVKYSNWMDGKQPELPFSQHCGVINGLNYTWSDENCWVPRSFLCEENIV